MNGAAEPLASAEHWDRYWLETTEDAAWQRGGPQDQLLENFWSGILRNATPGRALDLACGNGAVTAYVQRLAPGVPVCGCDLSRNALLQLRKRYPGCDTVVADAARAPFADASFDLVVSQFGLEYAGEQAFFEAARLVAPGGALAAVIHVEGGAIYQECERNRAVVSEIQRLDVLPLARAAFAAGFAAGEGTGSAADFNAAERALKPAVGGLEDLLRNTGAGIADGLARRLYRDIADVYQRLSAYEPADVLRWASGMERELQVYLGRMESMVAAALSPAAVKAVASGLTANGSRQLRVDTLATPGQSLPMAWTVVMRQVAIEG